MSYYESIVTFLFIDVALLSVCIVVLVISFNVLTDTLKDYRSSISCQLSELNHTICDFKEMYQYFEQYKFEDIEERKMMRKKSGRR